MTSSVGGGESLSDYGAMDENQFNEDGSFIGQYKTDRSRRMKADGEADDSYINQSNHV